MSVVAAGGRNLHTQAMQDSRDKTVVVAEEDMLLEAAIKPMVHEEVLELAVTAETVPIPQTRTAVLAAVLATTAEEL